MPTPTKGKRLGGSPSHERQILANLATGLFEHGRITTTETKARRLRPFAERLITKARRGDLHARRQVMRVIGDKSVVHVLFTEIGPRFHNRPGGYTRITKIGPRAGDNAPMAVVELVEALAESSDGSSRRQRRTEQPAPQATAAAAPAAAPESEQPEQVAADEAAAEEAVADSGSAEDTTAGETPAGETPTEETAAGDTAAEETGAEETGAEDAPAETSGGSGGEDSTRS